MCKKCFLTLIGLLFSAKAIFILVVWIGSGFLSATLNDWPMPTWLFYVAIIVDLLLAVWALKLATCCGHECKGGKKKRK